MPDSFVAVKAHPEGFEPLTLGSEDRCSIRHPHPHRNHLLAAVDARQVAFGAHVVKEDDVAGAEAEVRMRDELPMNNRPHVNGGGRNLQNQDSKHLASSSCHQGSNREQ